MVFVATDNVEENVFRVARRGHHGGHSAPQQRIREIYQLSLANLPDAIDVFDDVFLYDSSAFDQPPRLGARFVNGRLVSPRASLPRWCETSALRKLLEK